MNMKVQKTPDKKFCEIPAISILNGSIVLARGKSYETLTIDNKVPDTLNLIEMITEHYETIYLMDLNGLIDDRPQVKFIKEVTDFCDIWLEAGVNKAENIYDLFVAGAQEVVLSSKTLDSFLELAHAFDLSENLIFELDYHDGIISPSTQIQDMSPYKFGEELIDIGIERLIFADLGRIGEKKSVEKKIIDSLIDLGFDLYIGGGVKISDSLLFRKLKASGSIVELTDVLHHGPVEF